MGVGRSGACWLGVYSTLLPVCVRARVLCLSLFFQSFSLCLSVSVCLSRVPRGCLLLGQHSFEPSSPGPGAQLFVGSV